MSNQSLLEQRLRDDAREAEQLHERSRTLLVSAARRGLDAGLSQREIAAAIGRSQPEVSRLLRFQGRSELALRLMVNRREIQRIARRFGAKNLRVFGSVARGTDTPQSDIDLLVDLAPGTSLFDLARLEIELGDLLESPVDISPARSLGPHISEQVVAEAIPL